MSGSSHKILFHFYTVLTDISAIVRKPFKVEVWLKLQGGVQDVKHIFDSGQSTTRQLQTAHDVLLSQLKHECLGNEWEMQIDYYRQNMSTNSNLLIV